MAEAIKDGVGQNNYLRVNPDGSISTNSSLAIRQASSGGSQFIARANAGTNIGSSVWQMSKDTPTTISGVSFVVTTWASGNSNFDKNGNHLLTGSYW